MPIYMVERVMLGATMASVRGVIRAADETCRTFSGAGKPIRYLRSTFTPGESRCRCLFEADNADLVQELNDTAQLPYSRIVLAVALQSEATARDPGTEQQ